MTHAREQIAAAIVTALAAISGIDGLTVELRRVKTIAETDCPFLDVRPGEMADTGDFTGERGWTLTVEVEGIATGSTDEAAQAAAAALQAAVANKLFSDVTLGGKSRDIRPASSPAAERLEVDAASPVASFVDTYEIEFATEESDVTALV